MKEGEKYERKKSNQCPTNYTDEERRIVLNTKGTDELPLSECTKQKTRQQLMVGPAKQMTALETKGAHHLNRGVLFVDSL